MHFDPDVFNDNLTGGADEERLVSMGGVRLTSLKSERILLELRRLMSHAERPVQEPDYPNPHPAATRNQVLAERAALKKDYQERRALHREACLADIHELLDELKRRNEEWAAVEAPEPILPGA